MNGLHFLFFLLAVGAAVSAYYVGKANGRHEERKRSDVLTEKASRVLAERGSEIRT